MIPAADFLEDRMVPGKPLMALAGKTHGTTEKIRFLQAAVPREPLKPLGMRSAELICSGIKTRRPSNL